MNRIAGLLMSAFLLAGSAMAQDSAPQEKVRTFTFTQDGPMPVMPGNMMMLQREKLPEGEISFFGAEMATAGELVTAAPYSATATEETTQALADGNRIVNKNSSFVARDSQGRTRREIALHRIGPLQVDSPKMVFINDPTTHTQYIFTPGGEGTKVVRKEGTWSEGPQIVDLRTPREKRTKEKTFFSVQGVHEGQASSESKEQIKHEELGTQTIEGVSAEGKRDTVTIPSGQIGNERPIDIVSETWFSPELHTTVLRKHSDPRVGETVFRLTEIKRVEPDAALFQAPAGTKLRNEPMIEIHRDMSPSRE